MGASVNNILGRYLVRQNLFLVGVILAVGCLLYLLMDLFDRLDNFLSAGLGFGVMATYYAVKLPLIISQILPVVLLLALVVQFGFMARNRELMALRAGGLPLSWLVRFVVIYGLAWSFLQLGFSQFVGVWGEQAARRIWREDVHNKQLDARVLHGVWFREGNYIIESDAMEPVREVAHGVVLYEFDPDTHRLLRIVSSKQAVMESSGWAFLQAVVLDTRDFSSSRRDRLVLPITQEMQAFAAVEGKHDHRSLSLWQLGRLIQELESSGSNVERLRTAWHAKISYAFTVLCLLLMALALYTFSENIYINIGVALAAAFAQYGLYLVGVSAGEQGTMHPLLAAWLGNITVFLVAMGWLQWVVHWRLRRAVLRPVLRFRRLVRRSTR